MPTVVQPYAMRSDVSEEGGRLQISIPMQRKWFVSAFIACWLGGWTVAGVEVVKRLLTNFELFSAFWMGGWALGELFALSYLLRSLGGRDVIWAAGEALEIRKDVFGVGVSKQYLCAEIRNLRFQPETGSGKHHRVSRIAFDYGAKTIGLGDGLDEAEANQLISLIRSRCPIANSGPVEASEPRFWRGQ